MDILMTNSDSKLQPIIFRNSFGLKNELNDTSMKSVQIASSIVNMARLAEITKRYFNDFLIIIY